jgi:hypothetical protein
MITTVSTTTVTTVTAMATMGLAATLSLAATILLIFFLSTKELVAAKGSVATMRISRFLSIGIVPLIVTFAIITIIQIIQILS